MEASQTLIPTARPTSLEIRTSQSEFSAKVRRYKAIRKMLLPEQSVHYDKELNKQLHREFPPDLMEWARYFFRHYFTKPSSLMHKKIAKDLQWLHKQRGSKIAKIAPRSGAKTTWTSKIYPLYCICHSFENYILLIGDTTEQSWQNLEAIKHELTDNPDLIQAYPDVCGEGPNWNQSYIVTRNGIKVEALGSGKRIRGRNKREHRPGLVIIDDLDNDESVMSSKQRVKSWNWFSKALMAIGSDDTNFIMVGTALHREDTIHRAMKAGWDVELFKGLIHEATRQDLWQEWRKIYCDFDRPFKEREAEAKAFFKSNRDAMVNGAMVVWPERQSLYFYMKYRADSGEASFLSEYQGVPSSELLAEWPAECFAGNLRFEQWPKCILKVMSLDPSKGKTDTSDYSAYVIVGLSPDGYLFVEADIARRDTTRIIEDGFVLYDQHRPDDIIIEINQYQELLMDEFNRQARVRNQVLPITGVNNMIKKETRIRMIGPYLRQGRIRFKSDSPGTDLLIEQLREFPNCTYDDGPDALHGAIKDIERLTLPVPEE